VNDAISQKPWLEALHTENSDAAKMVKSATKAFNQW
jgi:hypothetical protein